MENYIKAVLCAYPFLATAREDYAQHIKNKALLSYESRMDVEKLTEYLVEEILHKERLEWLKGVMEEVFSRLSKIERALLGVYFFGERSGEKSLFEESEYGSWKAGKQTSFKEKLYEKVGVMLRVNGLTKQTFEEELLGIELIRKIYNQILRREKRSYSSCS